MSDQFVIGFPDLSPEELAAIFAREQAKVVAKLMALPKVGDLELVYNERLNALLVREVISVDYNTFTAEYDCEPATATLEKFSFKQVNQDWEEAAIYRLSPPLVEPLP